MAAASAFASSVLPTPGGTLDEQRLVEPGHEEDGGRQARVGDVAMGPQRVDDLVDGLRKGPLSTVAGTDWVMVLRSSLTPRSSEGAPADAGAPSTVRPRSRDGRAQDSRSSRSPLMQWSTTGRTVSNVHSLALPGVQASPRTWLVMRSTSARVADDLRRVLVVLRRALAEPVLRVAVLLDVDEPLRDAHVAQQPDRPRPARPRRPAPWSCRGCRCPSPRRCRRSAGRRPAC